MRTAVLRAWRGGIGETIRTLVYALLIALVFRKRALPAILDSLRIHEANPAHRGLPVRFQIRLWLLPATRFRFSPGPFPGRPVARTACRSGGM